MSLVAPTTTVAPGNAFFASIYSAIWPAWKGWKPPDINTNVCCCGASIKNSFALMGSPVAWL